ncbi:substrate-binding periplasmic protein [Chitinimonas sp. PSY-7]|uniref:transporter substrate-binding domain-containing protein n=1 Tax=Chitinimonas sp. PSY-7 TaxID=3459088 RepID=UPI00404011EB
MGLFAIALLLQSTVAARDITLTNGEWPPYLSEHLKYYGIASHIVTDAFTHAGVKVQYVFRPWKRAYLEAESGKFDGSVVWSYEKERAEKFHFSDPIFEGKSVFFHLKSFSFNWTTFEDLIPIRVGGTLGYAYEFEKVTAIQVQRADTDVDNFKKLLAGRFDIFPSEMNVGYATLQQNFTPAEVNHITYHPKAYNVVTYHLILTKSKPGSAELLAAFNKGLKALKDSGKYNSYFDVPQ